jgi:hypothetical protein
LIAFAGPISRRPHDQLGRRIARAAGAVLDLERLAELLRQPAPDQAGEDVVRAVGREADDEAHGL